MRISFFEATVRGGRGSFEILQKMRLDYDAPRYHRRIVVLVHGYNVSENSAIDEFAVFTNGLIERRHLARGQICHFFWPGDFNSIISPLSYPFRVKTATACGLLLSDYLADIRTVRGTTPQITIVAHSLGCRVALEAAAAMPPRVREQTRLILMAAAYPVATALSTPMSVAILTTKSTLVLHSDRDSILRRYFPIGEQAAAISMPLILPEAVGLRGNPKQGVWEKQRRMKGFDHGDYWRSEDVHDIVAEDLEPATSRSTPLRPIKTTMPAVRKILPRLSRQRSAPSNRRQ